MAAGKTSPEAVGRMREKLKKEVWEGGRRYPYEEEIRPQPKPLLFAANEVLVAMIHNGGMIPPDLKLQLTRKQEEEIVCFYKGIDPSVNVSPLTNPSTARGVALVFTQIYLNFGFSRKCLSDAAKIGKDGTDTASLKNLQLQLARSLARKDTLQTKH